MGQTRKEALMNAALLVGRVLLAVSLVPMAVAHVGNMPGLARSLALQGLPGADALTAVIVLTECLGPLALAFGVAPQLSVAALMVAGLVTTAVLHRFWEYSGAVWVTEHAQFMGAIGSMGGLLLFAVAGPGAWSWKAWREGPQQKRPHKKKVSRPRAAKPKLVEDFGAEEEMEEAA
jgi:putative oxidoreductase